VVQHCRCCKRREREIAGLLHQRDRDHEEIARLRIERDELRAQLKDCKSARREAEAARDRLAARLQENLKHRFGRRSERADRGEADAPAEADESGGAHPGEVRRRRGQQPGRPSPRRRSYEHLATDEVPHDFEEPPRCPHCDTAYEAFGEERYEEIHFEVRICRRVHVRHSYRRRCRCERAAGIVIAPGGPKPIAKGRLSVGFLARLVYYKFGLGLPLARIIALLASEGAQFSPASLTGSLDRLGELLHPLAEAIRQHNGADTHLHVDETSWKVFVLVEGKTNYRHWVWVFVGKDSVAFYLKPSRGRDVVIEHLGLVRDDTGRLALPRDGELLLSSDFYTTYQSLGQEVAGIVNLWCWAHIRRYFLRCGEGHKSCRAFADAWVERIKALYRSWHAYLIAPAGSDEEAEAFEGCRRVVSEMDEVRKAEAHDPRLPDAARKVLATLDHEWVGLSAFLEHPEVSDIDNNRAERHLRRPVVLRKGCYGSRSLSQAQLAADAWTIIQTYELAQWNPLWVLEAFLLKRGEAARSLTSRELRTFLPWVAPPAAHKAFTAAPP
jgi:transposase